MFTIEGIIQIIIYIIIILFIVYGVLSKVKVSNTKIMIFGVALIAFSNSVLKGMFLYGIDILISIIGFTLCVVGLFKADK